MFTTFKDLLDHSADYLGLDTNTKNVRAIYDSAISGFRALESVSNWRYYRRAQILNLNMIVSPVNLGSYTQSTRTVVWPDGLPSWFKAGCSMNTNNNVTYDVQDLDYSNNGANLSTQFLLQPFSNPGANLSPLPANSSLIQYTYELPDDFKELQSVGMTNSSFLSIYPVSDSAINDLIRRQFATGTPRRYCVTGSQTSLGKMAIKLHPIPNITNSAVRINYTRRPRQLVISDVSTGTITATAGSNVITGTGTSFLNTMVGSIFRRFN